MNSHLYADSDLISDPSAVMCAQTHTCISTAGPRYLSPFHQQLGQLVLQQAHRIHSYSPSYTEEKQERFFLFMRLSALENFNDLTLKKSSIPVSVCPPQTAGTAPSLRLSRPSSSGRVRQTCTVRRSYSCPTNNCTIKNPGSIQMSK